MSALKVDETTITAKNAFNPDHLWIEEGKHESKKRGASFLLGVFADSWVVP